MNLAVALTHRDRVEAFQRRHRVGLVTLLFTDVVGSTRLKQALGDTRALEILEEHQDLVRDTLHAFDEGEEISTAGDSFFLVFTRPSDAVKFSLLLQHRLRQFELDQRHELALRVGLHVGEVLIAETEGKEQARDLYGMQVDICARVSALAQGRQILMTRFAFDSARQVLKGTDLEGIGPLVWMNHGRYRLKGVEEPVEICAVGEQGSPADTRPANTDKGHRLETSADEPVLGWRPALNQVVPQTRWELEKMLGTGGFGEVWLARHQLLGHQCVFKFCFRADRARSLRREVALFRVLRERFGSHPHIVSVRDVFFDEPPYYLAMDYSDSLDLRAWCESCGGPGPVPLAVRLEIVAQVADALQAAHDAGIVHRDVKPANILISGQGTPASPVQVKLTDFGIGQVVSEEVLAALSKEGFTQTGVLPGGNGFTGTQLYMAPELVAGRPASAASDIYALGVVLYQLLVSDFTSPVAFDWTEEVTDPVLRKTLGRCFAGNPKKRFARIGDLAESLRAPMQAVTPSVATGSSPQPVVQPSAPPASASTRIDLSSFCNASLADDWCDRPGLNLASLPRKGPVRIRGTEFDCGGIIQVGCFGPGRLKTAYPQRVEGIPIRCKCRRLHFLHAALGCEVEGARVGNYVLETAAGRHEIPLIYGEDLRSWLYDSDPRRDLKRATTGWTGRTVGLFLRSVRLFLLTWKNPDPDVEVLNLAFHSVPSKAPPFLIALTAE